VKFHEADGHDIDLTRLPEYKVNRLGIARKFQTPSVYNQHTVFDNLLLSLNRPRGAFKGPFYKMTPADREEIESVLETIRLTDRRNDLAGFLSHGQKQWLEIAMLVMQEPRLLLVDEPVSGMTHQEMDKTAELLHQLAGKHSVVVVEHDMDFVRSIASDVTVLHQGSVLAEGSMDQVQANPEVVSVYLGE